MIPDVVVETSKQLAIIIGMLSAAGGLMYGLAQLPAGVRHWQEGQKLKRVNAAEELLSQRQRDQDLTALLNQFKTNDGNSLRDRVNYIGQGVDEIWSELENVRKWQEHHDGRLADSGVLG